MDWIVLVRCAARSSVRQAAAAAKTRCAQLFQCRCARPPRKEHKRKEVGAELGWSVGDGLAFGEAEKWEIST